MPSILIHVRAHRPTRHGIIVHGEVFIYYILPLVTVDMCMVVHDYLTLESTFDSRLGSSQLYGSSGTAVLLFGVGRVTSHVHAHVCGLNVPRSHPPGAGSILDSKSDQELQSMEFRWSVLETLPPSGPVAPPPTTDRHRLTIKGRRAARPCRLTMEWLDWCAPCSSVSW